MKIKSLTALLLAANALPAVGQPPTPISPANEESEVSTTAVFSWSEVGGAVEYELAIRDPQTTAAFRDTIVTETSATVVLPIAEWDYYWKVRSIFQSDTSAWSDEFFFTAGAEGPLAPALMEPEDMTAGAATPWRLDWREAPDAVDYHIQVADNVTFIKPHLVNDTLETGAATEWTLEAGLETDTRYYWRVRGIAENGIDWTWTRARWFTTAPPVSIEDDGGMIPDALPSLAIWPNPVIGAATVELRYEGDERIGVAIFDLLGRRVKTLMQEEEVGGIRRLRWVPQTASGLYIVRVAGDRFSQTQQVPIVH